MKKIAILGGAFDPITNGHIGSAKLVLERKLVDEVWIMPAYKSMTGKNMTDFEHRYNMCEIATKDIKNIFVSDFERVNKNIGSTDLIEKLKQEYKDIDFHFIIGLDNALTIHKWKNPDKFLELVKVITLYRKGYEEKEEIDWYKKYPHIYLDDIDLPLISSTVLRNILIENKLSRKNMFFLKENMNMNIFNYIYNEKLYL